MVYTPQPDVARLVSRCQDELVRARVEGQVHNAVLGHLY